MKKSIIAAGAASVALAAMPVLGAFANTSTNVVDNITATVEKGCTITRANAVQDDANNNFARSVAITVTAGTLSTPVSSDQVTVTCSDGGWNVIAKGTGTNAATDLYNATLPNIIAGTSESGSTSNWAYKVAYSDGDQTVSGTENVAGSWAGITSGGEVVIPATTNNHGTFTPSYRVFAAADQASGQYTGQVTYTVHIPAGTVSGS